MPILVTVTEHTVRRLDQKYGQSRFLPQQINQFLLTGLLLVGVTTTKRTDTWLGFRQVGTHTTMALVLLQLWFHMDVDKTKAGLHLAAQFHLLVITDSGL